MDTTLIDTGKVIGANIAAMGVTAVEMSGDSLGLSAHETETIMAITSWVVAIGYTIWKWVQDYKKNKQ